jgi:hypothetical protein
MPPSPMSIEFHAHFFPALLYAWLRQREKAATGFSSILEFHIALAICAVLAAIGIPIALSRQSFTGWAMGGIGLAGILALLINSIISHRDPPSYDQFLTGVFFFFPALGITAGVFTGTLNHSVFLGLLAGSGGLVAGYLLGILAGLWLQHLGWLSGIVNGMAWLVILGMLLVDMVLLAG